MASCGPAHLISFFFPAWPKAREVASDAQKEKLE
jgi:hypothetical protein